MSGHEGRGSGAILGAALSALLWSASPAQAQLFPAQDPADDTGRSAGELDVLPFLHLRCTVCHGGRTREAGLDLRTRESVLAGGDSGPAIVPGRPDESLLLRKITAGEMPPRRRLVEVSVKVMRPLEVELLREWIEAGALPAQPARPVSDEPSSAEREFWAFQSPRATAPPEVQGGARVRNPVDAFVLARLEERGLSLAPEADRRTLLRRASFDLTGLPPTPEETRAFLEDSSPDAYERLIDRLLASPRYGERWARHWLDVAGYSDSEGVQHSDPVRPEAWRYRDYVIRAFNQDKPYDRFLSEQLAGDELADHEAAELITQELEDLLVATGFLRMAADGTFASITNFVPDRLGVIDAEVEVLSSATLGMTFKCARCHDHRFDPISQRDYYGLTAVLKGAYDEHDWLKPHDTDQFSYGDFGQRYLPHVESGRLEAWRAREERLSAEIEAVSTRLAQAEAPLRARLVEEAIAALPEVLHADLRELLVTAPEQRSEVQRYLLEKFASELEPERALLVERDEDFRALVVELEPELARLEGEREARPQIRALWDRGQPSPTFVLERGEYLAPGELIEPGLPAVLTGAGAPYRVEPPWPGAHKTGRRLALARWLTQPEHPLTARVLVNRVWKHHFGRGIVSTLDNFGASGALPTHPELLDWLALELVEGDWSIKRLHRLLMCSSTYRQVSATTPERTRLDPDNALLSRMPLARLDAEALYDSLLLVAGRLDETPFGPADGLEVREDGLVTPVGSERGWRRSIYVLQRRTLPPTLHESFDLPRMSPNCVERPSSTVATQALHMLNNGRVHALARDLARRVREEAGPEPRAQIEHMYQLALARAPGAEELSLQLEAHERLREQWPVSERAGADEEEDPALLGPLSNLCHAMLNSAEFCYLD